MSLDESSPIDRPEAPRVAPPLGRLARRLMFGAAEQWVRPGSPQRLSVTIFHRVLPKPDPFLASDPDAAEFAAIMTLLRERFSPLSLAEGMERLRNGTLPPRAVCVTFDDGYADNLLVALPILKRLEIPATVFVASGYLDGRPMWNDRLAEALRRCPDDRIDLSAYGYGVQTLGDLTQRAALARSLVERLKHGPVAEREQAADALSALHAPDMPSPMMTRGQVRELHSGGVEIGGHTVSHPILARTEDRLALQEIADNKDDLEGLLGERLRFFAYPNGKPELDFTLTHADMVRRVGYQGAVTTSPGVSTARTHPYRLPRFTPWERDPTRFGLRLLLNARHLV